MRISDWSSDVCSSDLPTVRYRARPLLGNIWPSHHQHKTAFPIAQPTIPAVRSEEHTSELQSLMRISYAVFCLKKKKYTRTNIHKTRNPSDRTPRMNNYSVTHYLMFKHKSFARAPRNN